MENKNKLVLLVAVLALGFGIRAQAQIPPASDPHCAYCGVNLITATAHMYGCPYWEAPKGQMNVREEDYVQEEDYYSQPEIYYPISTRDIEQARAMRQAASEIGYAVGNAIGELFVALLERAYDSAHQEFHAQEGRYLLDEQSYYAVTPEDGKGKGVWNNNRHDWAVQPGYSDIFLFNLSAAPMRDAKTGRWGLYDVEGRRVQVPFEYDECKFGYKMGMAVNVLIALGKKDASGYMKYRLGTTKYGVWIWQPGEYANVEIVNDGLEDVMLLKDWKTGKSSIIDCYGRELVPPLYDNIIITGHTEEYIDRKCCSYIVENGSKRGFLRRFAAGGTEAVGEGCVFDQIKPLAGYPDYSFMSKGAFVGFYNNVSGNIVAPEFRSITYMEAPNKNGQMAHCLILGFQDGHFEARLGFGKLIINAVNTSSYEDAVQQAKTFVQGLEVQKFGQINI